MLPKKPQKQGRRSHSSILVSGATEPGGEAFAYESLAQHNPPDLTLYVNSRCDIHLHLASRVAVVEGALTNDNMLDRAMKGVDTVVSFLLPYSYPVDRSLASVTNSFDTIIRVMKRRSICRILAMSTARFLLPFEHRPLSWSTHLILSQLSKPRSTAQQIALVSTIAAHSDIQWTIFRVPHLIDIYDEMDLPVWAGGFGPGFKGTSSLSTTSLATWLLDEIREARWVRKAPALGNYGGIDDGRIVRSTVVG